MGNYHSRTLSYTEEKLPLVMCIHCIVEGIYVDALNISTLTCDLLSKGNINFAQVSSLMKLLILLQRIK